MRILVIVLVALGLAAGGFYLWKQKQDTLPFRAAAREPAAARVEPRNIQFVVTAAGDIGPADQVSVRMEVNGRIAELPVDIGDTVKKGELLCRLDDRDLQIERDQRVTEIAGAKLQIEAARLRLEKARRDFDRNRKLFEETLISKETFENFKTDFDQAQTQLEIANNSLERADKALKIVEDRITKTRMEAPFDCTVLTRPVSLGQTVSGAAGFNSGTEIMSIANLNDMVVNAHINQADVIRLSPRQKVSIQVESLPGVKIEGEVERIAPQATIRNNIKGFATRIQIKNMDPRVRPGMTATLTIPVAGAENALAVPLGAVFTENGERFVYVRSGSGLERRLVKIGVTDYQFAEIQEGLREGEMVLIEPPKEESLAAAGAAKGGPKSGGPAGRANAGGRGKESGGGEKRRPGG